MINESKYVHQSNFIYILDLHNKPGDVQNG
jgi:hypothetical protein